jgi:hypothetical protein
MRKMIDPAGYDTDKVIRPQYLKIYEEYFEPIVSEDI